MSYEEPLSQRVDVMIEICSALCQKMMQSKKNELLMESDTRTDLFMLLAFFRSLD